MNSLLIAMGLKKPVPDLRRDIDKELEGLERDIIERELTLIDAQHKIESQKVKRDHIHTWLEQRKSANDSTL